VTNSQHAHRWVKPVNNLVKCSCCCCKQDPNSVQAALTYFKSMLSVFLSFKLARLAKATSATAAVELSQYHHSSPVTSYP
jgi:hypothetical protein